MLKYNKSKDLFNKGKYNESFRFINELYLNSNTDMERELFSKDIINMKIEHINNITNKNINLLNSNRNNEIIEESEKIFKQYNDDISLSKPLHEMKIVYCKALQNLILSKKKNGENFKDEIINLKLSLRMKNFLMNLTILLI